MTDVYVPPKLPNFLASAFDLKPLVGIPTDEEVMLIHSAIRAVENTSHIPTLFNSTLSMDLSRHLFEVQMARYKSSYYFPMLSDITYTPPELPSHIDIKLETVVNAPSDGQLKSAQAAFRLSESMASVPSMYNAELNMRLSQHLFDLQLARYIQHRTEGNHNARDASAGKDLDERPQSGRSSVSIKSESDVEPVGSLKSNCQDSAAKSSSRLGSESQPSCPNSSDLRSATIAFSTGVNAIVEQLRVNRDQNNRRLDEIQDRLKDGLNDGLKNALEVAVDKVTRMMIKLHNNSSRGFNSGKDHVYHHIVNEIGEAPVGFYVPGRQENIGPKFWNGVLDSTLAGYLQFYKIGLELVEQGAGWCDLKPDSTEKAVKILGRYTHSRII